MKKNVMKTMVAAVCVAAAGMGGFQAYNAADQSEADMLLAENVEALSNGDDFDWKSYNEVKQCPFSSTDDCTYEYNGQTETREGYTNQGDRGTNYPYN